MYEGLNQQAVWGPFNGTVARPTVISIKQRGRRAGQWKPATVKKTDGRRLPVYTSGLNCRIVANPHTRLSIRLSLRHPPPTPSSEMWRGGRRDWPMSRESQELLVSINGLSAAVKCCANDLAAEFPSWEIMRSCLSAIAVTSNLFFIFRTFNIDACPPRCLSPFVFTCEINSYRMIFICVFFASLTHLNLVQMHVFFITYACVCVFRHVRMFLSIQWGKTRDTLPALFFPPKTLPPPTH